MPFWPWTRILTIPRLRSELQRRSSSSIWIRQPSEALPRARATRRWQAFDQSGRLHLRA